MHSKKGVQKLVKKKYRNIQISDNPSCLTEQKAEKTAFEDHMSETLRGLMLESPSDKASSQSLSRSKSAEDFIISQPRKLCAKYSWSRLKEPWRRNRRLIRFLIAMAGL